MAIRVPDTLVLIKYVIESKILPSPISGVTSPLRQARMRGVVQKVGADITTSMSSSLNEDRQIKKERFLGKVAGPVRGDLRPKNVGTD